MDLIRIQQDCFDVGAELARVRSARRDIGALVCFEGVCRDRDGQAGAGVSIRGLELEHYPGMTETAIAAMVDQARRRWPLLGVTVIHRVGRLEPGEPIVLLIAASAHREAAFEAAEFLMDFLKTQAPIWKLQATERERSWVTAREADDAALRRWGVNASNAPPATGAQDPEVAPRGKSPLTHFDAGGRAHMVDVGGKAETSRVAVASGSMHMLPATLEVVAAGGAKKGDVLGVARLAGIMSAKRAADLIPLCHPIALTSVTVELELDRDACALRCTARAETRGPTGVEMEALTAVQIALLTVYDMGKAVDRGMVMTDIRLLEKAGGKSGRWTIQPRASDRTLVSSETLDGATGSSRGGVQLTGEFLNA